MSENLSHTDVQRMMASFAESKVVNLEVPLRTLVESARSGLPDTSSDKLSLHILCCNEYFLVTGIAANPLDEITRGAGQVRESLG